MSILTVFSWTLLLLVQGCSTTQSSPGGLPRPQPQVLSHPHRPPQTTEADSHCPSCALARMRRSGGGGAEGSPEVGAEEAQQDVVEAVKRHILNMLHLQARPNVTRPVPRAALLNALRKLHVGRVAEDGSVQIEGDEEGRGWGPRGAGRGRSLEGGEAQETTEIITFAEAGDSQGVVNFVLSKDGGDLSLVEQANVWIFLRLAKSNRSRAKVTVRLVQQHQAGDGHREGVQLAEKTVDTRRSGWHTFPVSGAVQALLDSAGGSTLSMRVSCPLCADAGATPVLVSDASSSSPSRASQREQSHRPFLMAVVRPADLGDGPRRRRKRGLECDGKVRVCCKRQFYVNFKDIGWNDWIIAPPGYHANYCEGDCPTHVASITGSSLSFHSTVINHYRMRGYSPFQNIRSCCVPTRLRAMSMLYYNEEQKIVKKDIQNMIVEECGCS